MNKKFFGFLLGFAALLSVGTLQSCKDTNDDLDAEIHGVSSNLSALEQRVKTLEGYDIPAMKTKLDAIKSCICDAQNPDENCKWDEERIKGIEEDVEALEKAVVILQNSPTGVTVQSVYTPAIGTVNTPFGINNNVLVVLKGNSATAIPELNVPAGQLVKNPGKIYLTVDPLNVNYSDVDTELGLIKTKLVNSKGEAAPIALSALKVSEEVISLGYTRANNYLYETEATVADVDALETVKLDKAAFAAAAKDLLDRKDGVDLTALANLMINTVNQKLTANAVEVEYVDEEGESHSVVSKYQIGAVAVTPLNLHSLDALTSAAKTAESKVLSFTNKLATRIQNKAIDFLGKKVNLPANFDKITFNASTGTYTVTVNQNVDATVVMDEVPVDLSGYNFVPDPSATNNNVFEVRDASNNLLGTVDLSDLGVVADDVIKFDVNQDASISLNFTIDITDTVNDIFSEINGGLDGVNDMIDEVNKMLNQVNNGVTSVLDHDYAANFNNVLAKILDKAVAAVDRLTHGVNPVLVAVVNGEAKVLSQVEAMPTVVPAGAEITIVPTSWTGEYIVPFYTKSVSATGATVSYDADKAYTGTMTVNGAATITYDVVDYAGNPESRTYYVVAE